MFEKLFGKTQMSAETSAKIEEVINKVTDVIPDSFAKAGESLDAALTKAVSSVKTFYSKG